MRVCVDPSPSLRSNSLQPLLYLHFKQVVRTAKKERERREERKKERERFWRRMKEKEKEK